MATRVGSSLVRDYVLAMRSIPHSERCCLAKRRFGWEWSGLASLLRAYRAIFMLQMNCPSGVIRYAYVQINSGAAAKALSELVSTALTRSTVSILHSLAGDQ
jgi:hypothetical protein